MSTAVTKIIKRQCDKYRTEWIVIFMDEYEHGQVIFYFEHLASIFLHIEIAA